jgi:mannose-6-phosphate isomerase-like protein (cupin superfamily)
MSNQRLNGWNPQKTVYTYAKDRKFETGLRKGGLYADLGLAEATGGQFHGELIKTNPDYSATDEEKETTGMHRHHYDFQFNYVLSGEIDLVIEEEEETTFRAGDTYFIPSRALHDETRVTEDFRVMQIYGPAKAETVTVGQAAGGGEVSNDWSDKLSKMKEQRLTGWNKQKPAFTFAKSREFGSGLRKASLYADLGLAEATGGQFHGEIIKINNDVHTPQGTTGMHRHEYDFQFNYILAGDIDFVIEGINDKPGDEKLVFRAGDTYFLSSRVLHNETHVSEDFSVLQVYGPANASTEQLTPEID